MKFKPTNSLGLVISGTKRGKDVFLSVNIAEDNYTLDDLIPDVRTPVQWIKIGVTFFSIEYQADHHRFTIYETIYDWSGSLGYCAISVLMPMYEGKVLRTTDELGANNAHIMLQNLMEIYKSKYLNTNCRIKENKEDVSLFTAELDKYKATSVLINTSRKIDSTQKCGILFENDTDLANIFDAYDSKDLRDYGQVFLLNNKDKDKLSYGFGLVEIPKKDKVETVVKNTGEVKTVEEIAESLEKVEKPPIKKHSLYEEKCDVIIEIKQALDNNKEGVLKDATLLVDNKPYEPEPQNKYNGKYEIKDLLVGSTIEIKVSKEGYQDKSQTETISKENNLISIVLERKLANSYGVNSHNAANTYKKVSIIVCVKEGNKPLKGTNVSINNENNITDKNGECTISDLPVGEITIEVAKKGYKTVQEPKYIGNDGQKVEISLVKGKDEGVSDESNNNKNENEKENKFLKLLKANSISIIIGFLLTLVVSVGIYTKVWENFISKSEKQYTLEELSQQFKTTDSLINVFEKSRTTENQKAAEDSKNFSIPYNIFENTDSLNAISTNLKNKLNNIVKEKIELPNKIKKLLADTVFKLEVTKEYLASAEKDRSINTDALKKLNEICILIDDAKKLLCGKAIQEQNLITKLVPYTKDTKVLEHHRTEIELYINIIQRKSDRVKKNKPHDFKSVFDSIDAAKKPKYRIFISRQHLECIK